MPFIATVVDKGSGILVVTLEGELQEGWHANVDFELEKASGVEKRGDLEKIREGLYSQQLAITGEKYYVAGFFRYTLCDDQMCLTPEYAEFKHTGVYAAIAKENTEDKKEEVAKVDTVRPEKESVQVDGLHDGSFLSSLLWAPVKDDLRRLSDKDIDAWFSTAPTRAVGLWNIIFLGFIGGLLALFTPCVWPIIPLTISFFLKRKGGKRNALLFGGSIVALFVLLGLLVTIVFGENAMNTLSTSAVFNIICFIILVLFGLSLLGLFELKLPMKWGNSLDSMATKTTGLVSILLMALTLVVVSFSCTAPVIGLLLVEVATHGNMLAPILGMTSFALALALPFTVFALFPRWMNRMPRSGAWMNMVKVVLGILEIAFALKFLSIADQAYGWGILPPTAFLVIWAILFGGMAVFLAFSAKKKVWKAVLFTLPFALTVYLVQGIFTHETSFVSAFMPVDMSAYDKTGAESGNDDTPSFLDYEEGMDYAKQHKKLVFLDFTGYGCVNCRKMEGSVFKDARVQALLKERYVMIHLYVDDRTPLEKNEVVQLYNKQRILRTIGDKWSLLESYKFGASSQPYYVILYPETAKPVTYPYAYDEDVEKFLNFLNLK
ncbi:MAG: thioredoxin family protein [Prevotella sp.]|nr:thioredoxin family protein [Candidatus Prevotella equi]